MFGTADAREKRKGLKNLISALSYCIKDKEFKKLADAKKVVIICVGKADASIKELPIPLLDMGYVEDDSDMARIYNASDMFVLPSLEDNLPNTMIEAMACGTPVISFDVGGMPDVITSDVNGKLIPLKDDIGFGRAILELAFNSTIRRTMSEQCSSFIRNKFRLEDQAQNYIKLYDDLLKSRPLPTSTVVKHEGAYGTSVKTVYEDVLRFAKQKRNKMGLDR